MDKQELNKTREQITEIAIKIWKEKINITDGVAQILSLEGIRIECSNQDSPENSEPNPPDDREEIIAYQAYNSAQQDMLTPKDGKVWVRCLVKEERKK